MGLTRTVAASPGCVLHCYALWIIRVRVTESARSDRLDDAFFERTSHSFR